VIPLRDDIPTSITPFVTVAFIVVCVLTFLWQVSLGTEGFRTVVLALGVVPASLIGGQSLPADIYLVPPTVTVFSSMFLHGGWMHLIGNMLYLWIFGNNIEDAMGHVRFVLFYLMCGVAAALLQVVPNAESTIPMIGASGAISGVLGAYLLLYPRAQVLVLIPLGYFSRLIHLPAMFVLGFWFVLQLINSMLADPAKGGVAWGAHIGGFLAGMTLIPLFKYRRVRFFAPAHRKH
jgi:membrane associated rhomboid family serine protease